MKKEKRPASYRLRLRRLKVKKKKEKRRLKVRKRLKVRTMKHDCANMLDTDEVGNTDTQDTEPSPHNRHSRCNEVWCTGDKKEKKRKMKR
jgi:hypothetical protein